MHLFTIISKYFRGNNDFRVQIFNTLGFLGILLGLVFGVFSLFTHPAPENVISNFSASIVAVVVIWLANKTGNFKLFFLITVIIVFFIIFPVLFFMGGGITSGMPSFFVFAVVFTVIMLEGKRRAVFTILEIMLYAICFLIAYFFPGSVVPFPTEADMLRDIMIACLASSIVLGIAIYQHITVYDRKQRELEELNRLKIEFLGNVSHELKTPLTSVSALGKHSYSVMTEDWPINDEGLEEMRDNLRIIVVESDRMKWIVDELLNVAAVEQGEFVLHKEYFSLPGLADEISGINFKAINTNENRLEFDFAPDLPEVFADRNRLREVLLNLLTNSARHTKSGVIKISAQSENRNLEDRGSENRYGFITISVTDNGEGIPEKLQENLFERFLGADIGRAHGTGLGLYICKQIVEAHGGEIRIESEPGVGTSVIFTIPNSLK